MMMKIRCFLALIVIFSIQNTNLAQDLRDKEHTKKFADYLFNTGQYILASEEYERLVFYDSTNFLSTLRLFQSYRLSGKYGQAIGRFNSIFKDSICVIGTNLAEEYAKNLILNKKNQELIDYIQCNKTIEPIKKQNFILSALLLQKKWDTAFQYATTHPVTTDKKNAYLHVYAFKSQELKYKSPVGAAFMSSIIPGSGKAYTKNWKDGLISFMLVGLNSWQAYRGFNKYGKSSAYGWVFAGLAGSFYIGGIFGSHKSAKKYNEKVDEELYQETWHLIVDDF